MQKLRRWLYRFIATHYFHRPDIAELMEVRYRSWTSFIATGFNFLAFALKRQRIYKLTSLVIEPTNRCNLKCALCPVNAGMKRPKGCMDMALFKKLIDENRRELEYVLLFNWGEPFLHPGIFDMVDYAAQAGIPPYITTNGTLLDAGNIEKVLTSPLERLTISIDGLGPVYEKIRGIPYEKVLENIDALFKRREELGASLKVDVAITVSDLNEEDMEAFLESWKGKADRIHIQPAQNLGMAATTAYGRKREKPCSELWRGNLQVFWDGSVIPCCVDYEGVLCIGNANQEPLKKILNGKKMRRLRRQHLALQFLGICEKCTGYETHYASARFT